MKIIDIIKKTNINKSDDKPKQTSVNAEQQAFINNLLGERQVNGK